MWGTYTEKNEPTYSEFKSIGYVGLVKDNESGKCFYLCESGSKSLHDSGCFEQTFDDSVRSLLSRGTYNLFDRESSVKSAFEKKYNNCNFSLERVVSVEYTESVKIS